MYPYKFADGRTMHFPTRLSDIEQHEKGDLAVSDLLKRSGYQRDTLDPAESLIEIESVVLSPKRIDFTAHSLIIFEYVKKKTGYTGNLSMFVNDAISMVFLNGGKVVKIGSESDETFY